MRKWYALRVKYAFKEKVIHTLEAKGITCLSPVSPSVKGKLSIRSNEPGFLESLLFVKAEEQVHSYLLGLKGVDNLFYWGKSPAVINEKEILMLRYFSTIDKDLYFEKTPVDPIGNVEITTGPFLLREGDSYDVKSRAIKASLPSLGYIVAAETDENTDDPVLLLKSQQDISAIVEKQYR